MNGRKVAIYGREFSAEEIREHQQRRLEKAGVDTTDPHEIYRLILKPICQTFQKERVTDLCICDELYAAWEAALRSLEE